MLKDVYNQVGSPTCWAFSSTSLFEYLVDKRTNRNDTSFSVEHLVEKMSVRGNCGFLIDHKDGGDPRFTGGYFVSGYGPVNSEEYPWLHDTQLAPTYDFGRAEYRAKGVEYINEVISNYGVLTDDTIGEMKEAIYNNGAVTASIHSANVDGNYLSNDGMSYYVYNLEPIDHIVLIVGWDDNYSKNNFKTHPSSDGAWLVRNSWGSNWGQNGYYWVSYESRYFLPCHTINDYEEMDPSMAVYNLDKPGQVSTFETSDSEQGFLNVFDIVNNETLKEVTFYESEIGAECQAYYVPISSTGTPLLSQKEAIGDSLEIDYDGYHTIEIDETVTLSANTKCGIMIYVDAPDNSVEIGVEDSSQYYLIQATINSGESYYCNSNNVITDLVSLNESFGNFSIKLVTERTISISSCNVSEPDDVVFSGGATYSKPTVTYDGTKLKENRDYHLYFYNNTNAGNAAVVVAGMGNYTGSCTKYYTITKASISNVNVADIPMQCYTGNTIDPELSVSYNGHQLVAGTDYGVAHVSCTNVGTATIVLVGLGNYSGTKTEHFIITNDLSDAVIEGIYDYEYNGTGYPFSPVVKLCGTTLTQNTDYIVSIVPHYNTNNVDTYYYYVFGINRYQGQTFETYSVLPTSIANASIANIPVQNYTGNPITPTPTVTFNGQTLVEGVDYTVSFSNNVNVGYATLTLHGIGNFKNTKSKTFRIQ